MKLSTISSVSFSIVLLQLNHVKTHPQTNVRPSPQREVPHEVDCAISFRPAPADSPTNTVLSDSEEGGGGCECIPYYMCNNNKTMNAGGGILSGVGLVSSPPYKSCPCSQATSTPKPNNAGICPNYLDVCCIPPSSVLSDEYPNNDDIPGNPPWQNSPGNFPPWNNNSPETPSWNNNQPENYPPWNNNSQGSPPPWSSNQPENPPPWNNNSPGNSPSWNNPAPGNSPPWNRNSSGNSPSWNNQIPGNSPPWNSNSPGNSPSWNNQIPGNSPPWNSNSPGNSPSWNNQAPGNSPPSVNNSQGNLTPWNNQIPVNSPPWNSKPVDNKPAWNNNQPAQPSDSFPTCGRNYGNELNPQVQGEQEQYNDFPWMVAVYGDKVVKGVIKKNLFLCGGSLINPDVVLTAAHCVKGKTSLLIRAGVLNSNTDDGFSLIQEKYVHHVRIHDEFYAGALHNDIALLFLVTALEPGQNIGTVCLPVSGGRVNFRDCVVSGWGTRVFGSDENHSTTLKKIYLSIVPRKFCEEKLRTTRLGRHFHLHESFLCAKGRRGQDACTGDGGGPLVCPSLDDANSYVQVGVVSWGIGCGGDIPGVYVDVTHFRSWIDREMAILSIDERFRNNEK